MIRLIIADDHAIMRGGLRQIFALSPDVQVVGEATNGAEVLDWLRREPVDLLLLDMNMPGISGVDLIARIVAHQPDVPILVLSMHDEAQVAARAFRAGAKGYVTKDSEPELLLAAIRKVAAKGKYVSAELAEQMVFDATTLAAGPPHTLLSDREMEVFRRLIQGMSVNDVARELSISNKTVSTHKARLMEKLQLSSMANLMRYAMQHQLLD